MPRKNYTRHRPRPDMDYLQKKLSALMAEIHGEPKVKKKSNRSHWK